MDDLESSLFIRISGTQVSVVSAHSLLPCVLYSNVRDLENTKRQCERLVFAERLEQARDERCSNDLEFLGRGVEEFDGSRVAVFSVEVRKVFIVRTLIE